MPYANPVDALLTKNQILSGKCAHRPLSILHIVGGMNRGGIEAWLIHVLRHIDRDRAESLRQFFKHFLAWE